MTQVQAFIKKKSETGKVKRGNSDHTSPIAKISPWI